MDDARSLSILQGDCEASGAHIDDERLTGMRYSVGCIFR
jgi:hypothetical protein